MAAVEVVDEEVDADLAVVAAAEEEEAFNAMMDHPPRLSRLERSLTSARMNWCAVGHLMRRFRTSMRASISKTSARSERWMRFWERYQRSSSLSRWTPAYNQRASSQMIFFTLEQTSCYHCPDLPTPENQLVVEEAVAVADEVLAAEALEGEALLVAEGEVALDAAEASAVEVVDAVASAVVEEEAEASVGVAGALVVASRLSQADLI